MKEKLPVQNLAPAPEPITETPARRSLTERVGDGIPTIAMLTVVAALIGGAIKVLSD